MLIAHAPLAIISTRLAIGDRLKLLSKKKILYIYLFASIIGIIPDFDIFYLAMYSKPAYLHHSLITHIPIFWLILSIILFLTLKYLKWPKNKSTRNLILITFIVSSMSHIISDTIGGHIMFFTPFYSNYITLFGNILPDNIFGGYFANPLFGLEILLVFTSLFILLLDFIGKRLYILIALPTLYLLFNFFMYTKTYQVDLYKKDRGNPIYDTDKDRLADSYDLDVDNNFVDNFKQTNREEIANNINKILSQTNLISSRPKTLSSWFNYQFGGFTVLRAILQAYAQTGNYLTPVIHDYMSKNNLTKFTDSIVPYLLSTQEFKEVSKISKLLPGSLVLFKFEDTFKLGILLKNNKVLIESNSGEPTQFEISELNGELLIQE